jgi:uncharacterized membrane protein (DUF2068 family)
MKRTVPCTRAAAGYLALVAVLTTLYWIVFFTYGGVHVRDDAVYLAFEQAFPLADAWMAACSLLGAIGLWRGRPWGLLFGLLAASSQVFLGCLDVLFNLNQGNYAIASVAMAVEIVINVGLLVGAPLLIAFLWRHRRALLSSGSW